LTSEAETFQPLVGRRIVSRAAAAPSGSSTIIAMIFQIQKTYFCSFSPAQDPELPHWNRILGQPSDGYLLEKFEC